MKVKIITVLMVCILLTSSVNVYAANYFSEKDSKCVVDAAGIDHEFLAKADVKEQDGVLLLSCKSQKTLGKNEYSEDIVFLVPSEGYTPSDIEESIDEHLTQRSAGNKYESGRDSSISVTGYITIYYDRASSAGGGTVKLTKVSGGYIEHDYQVRVKDQDLTYGYTGWATGSYVSEEGGCSPTSDSWTYNMPNDWEYVDDDSPGTSVGASCEYTLQRVGNSHTWSFTVENFIVQT